VTGIMVQQALYSADGDTLKGTMSKRRGYQF